MADMSSSTTTEYTSIDRVTFLFYTGIIVAGGLSLMAWRDVSGEAETLTDLGAGLEFLALATLINSILLVVVAAKN